jgi:PAS domain S-box-containing protein
MNSNKKVISTRRLFALAFIVSFITVLCLGAYFYCSYEVKSIRREVSTNLEAISKLKITQIENWNNERFADAKVFSQSEIRLNELENLVLYKSSAYLNSEITKNLKLLNTNSDYSNIIISNTEGKPLLSLDPKHQQIDSCAVRFIKSAVKNKRITFTDLYRHLPSGKIYLDYIAPVINKENTVTAVVIFRVNPDTYLYPLIKEWPVQSKSSETLIVRRDDGYALFLNELNYQSGTALKLRIPLTRTDVPAVQAVLGYNGIFEGVNYRGENVLSYISPVSGTTWIMVALEDTGEIYAELYYKEIVIIIFTIVLIFVLLGGLWGFYHYRQGNIYRELFSREKELREYHEEFKTILYSVGDAIITLGTNGKIKNMNRTAEALTGWKESEAIYKPFEEVFKIINEETRSIVQNPVNIVLREGKTVGLANHTLLLSKDGREIPIADSGAPIKSDNDEILGVVLVFRDQSEERNAQKTIEESRQRFLSLFRNMNEGVALHELVKDSNSNAVNYRIIDVNPRFENILGINRNEVAGRLATEAYQVSEAPYLEIYSSVVRTGLSHTFETYFESMDKHFIISVVPWLNNGFATIFTDITGNKIAEEALRESEERFRTVYNASPSAISISEIGTGRLIQINEAYEKLFGFSKNESIGKSSFELGIWVNKADRERLIDVILKNNFYNNLEINFKSKNGSVINCLLSGRIIHIKNNNFMVTIIHDITNLKNATLTLKESEERFRKIFEEHSAVKLLIDSKTGEIVEANKAAAEYYGWTKEELLQMNINEINISLTEKIKMQMDQVSEHKKIHFEFVHRKKNGSIRDVEVFSSTVDIGGKEYLHSIIHDITKRKLVEEKLKKYSEELIKLNAGKDKMFSIIAHDLRGPFNPLLGISEIMANDFKSLSKKELKYYSKEIFNSLKNIYKLLENLLSWSRIETGQMQFNPEKINIYEKTENVINLLSEISKSKDISVFNETCKDIFVTADPTMLNSVMQNLIGNSIKFTYNGGSLRVFAEEINNGFIKVTVSDNGVGMDDKQIKNLFKLSVTSTRGTNNEKGTGLGLMICKEMVEKNGGTISVKSEAGKGTDISFTIPKAV